MVRGWGTCTVEESETKMRAYIYRMKHIWVTDHLSVTGDYCTYFIVPIIKDLLTVLTKFTMGASLPRWGRHCCPVLIWWYP